MKYKQFAKSASALVNGDHDSLELLEWCKERLTNEHGMTAIWDAQITRDVIDLFGTNEEKDYYVEWDLVFPNLQKVLEKYGRNLNIDDQKQLCEMTKETSATFHGYYGEERTYEIKFVDTYDLYKFIFNK